MRSGHVGVVSWCAAFADLGRVGSTREKGGEDLDSLVGRGISYVILVSRYGSFGPLNLVMYEESSLCGSLPMIGVCVLSC